MNTYKLYYNYYELNPLDGTYCIKNKDMLKAEYQANSVDEVFGMFYRELVVFNTPIQIVKIEQIFKSEWVWPPA